jgi:cytochrome c2
MNRKIIAVMLVVFCGAGRLARAQQAGPVGDAAQGKKDMVTYYCYSCHGYSAEGADTGPRIDTNKWTQPNFMAYVRKGGRQMPRFATEKQIPDAALANIYAFLKSRPANPDPKSIPLLNDK